MTIIRKKLRFLALHINKHDTKVILQLKEELFIVFLNHSINNNRVAYFLIVDTLHLFSLYTGLKLQYRSVPVTSGTSLCLPASSSGAPINSREKQKKKETCGWPERSVSARGHHWAFPLLCAFLICHSVMFRHTEGQTVTDEEDRQMENEQ